MEKQVFFQQLVRSHVLQLRAQFAGQQTDEYGNPIPSTRSEKGLSPSYSIQEYVLEKHITLRNNETSYETTFLAPTDYQVGGAERLLSSGDGFRILGMQVLSRRDVDTEYHPRVAAYPDRGLFPFQSTVFDPNHLEKIFLDGQLKLDVGDTKLLDMWMGVFREVPIAQADEATAVAEDSPDTIFRRALSSQRWEAGLHVLSQPVDLFSNDTSHSFEVKWRPKSGVSALIQGPSGSTQRLVLRAHGVLLKGVTSFVR